MIQLAPQMRILVAVQAQDFRKGIDGLARICREVLDADPFFCGGPQSVARVIQRARVACLNRDSADTYSAAILPWTRHIAKLVRREGDVAAFLQVPRRPTPDAARTISHRG